jgi:hypothetical protein
MLDPEHRRCTLRYTGVISIDDFQCGIDSRIDAGAWEWQTTIDLTEATGIAFHFDAAKRLAEYVRERAGVLPQRGPTVVVAPRPALYGIARMYKACIEMRGQSTRFEVVHSLAEADTWLQQLGDGTAQ